MPLEGWFKMLKLSRYIKTVECDEDVVLYNTINHAIMQLPKEAVKERNVIAELDDESFKILHDSYFFEETDQVVEDSLLSFLINEKKLFISLELNLSCNLRCPYCYQSGTHNGRVISDSALDSLVEYVSEVSKSTSIEDLYIKILGGEPTLVWKKFTKIFDSLSALCKANNIHFHLLVDTNGTRINEIVALEGYDSLLLTIPLSYRECHDKVRFDARGNGTYDLIVDNINLLHLKKPEAKIVIRYNVDGDNHAYFKAFLDDISSRLVFKPLISVNYTAELNNSSEFENGMTYLEFIKWSSSIAIDELLSADMPITISPIISIEECQFRSKYSLKLFSDGTVGSCAMSFFEKNRLSIGDLVDQFSSDNEFALKKKTQTIIADQQCMQCEDIFMCGGTSKLPCITALNANMCRGKHFSIDLDSFIKKYISSMEKGNNNLFVVFENGESYR